MECLYCGQTTNPFSKEHVLSEKLGCYETIESVCKICNNGVLSFLDTAMLDFSPLALVNVFREGAGEPGFLWGTSEGFNNLLLEGVYDFKSDLFSLYPQILFVDGRFQLHGDAEEMEMYGQNRLKELFLERAKNSLANVDGIRFLNQQVDFAQLDQSVSYPPRAFAKSINALENGEQLYLRFCGTGNQDFMDALKQGVAGNFANLEIRQVSAKAKFCLIYRQDLIQRALIKFALNSIAYACHNTVVNYRTFNSTAKIAMGVKVDPRQANAHTAQMVPPNSIQKFYPTDSRHAIRLSYAYRHWQCTFSFFTGAAAALVTFPGISDEKWKTADIILPTTKTAPSIEHYVGSLLANGNASWDLAELIPSRKIENYSTVSLGTTRWKGLRI